MEMIKVESLVSSETGKPWVKLSWGQMKGQLTPAEARAHALNILEAAGSADLDVITIEFFTKRVGITWDTAAQILIDFRKIREEKALNDL